MPWDAVPLSILPGTVLFESRCRVSGNVYSDITRRRERLTPQLPEAGYVPRFIRRQAARAADDKPNLAVVEPLSQVTESAQPDNQREPAPAPFITPTRKLTLYLGLGVVLAACAGLILNSWARLASSDASTRVADVSSPVRPPARVLADAGQLTEVRIAAGSPNAKYLDHLGRVWEGDRYFKGGVAISRPTRKIERTFDAALYQSAREGDFQYDIPLKPGVYQMHLHFAEIVYGASEGSSAEGRRRFRVTLNNKPLLTDFDIALDAPGTSTANERVFKDVSPAEDGLLHLRFESLRGGALVNAIEIVPGIPGRMHPVRILTGLRKYYDSQGRFWGPDRYFSGGRFYLRSVEMRGTSDPDLFTGERFGYFRYFIPVAEGRYTVTLRFAESNFGATNFAFREVRPEGNRLFDIYCNGRVLEKNFDILKQAGAANVALERTFSNLEPNAQGKLVLSFVPTRDYATVGSIEVVSQD